MGGKRSKKKSRSKKSGSQGAPQYALPAVLAVAAVVAAAFFLSSWSGSASDGTDASGVVRVSALKDGSYPDVVGKVQILDYGVEQPRSIDGPIPFRIVAKVPTEDWGPRRAVAQPNVERMKPLVMKNSVVSTWEAMQRVNPEFFVNEVPSWRNITRVKRFRRSFINYEYGAMMENVTPEGFWENVDSRVEIPMGIERFLELCHDHSDEYIYAYAEEVPKEMLQYCNPRHQLKLRGQTWVYFSVWMGEGGATTAAHFDIDDNFYVHFYGRKRFLLFPPHSYLRWKSFPRLSPNHKQVQMDRSSPSRYSYLLKEGAPLPEAYEAILEPGDMLYIPSYWYHHVEAMISPPGTSPTGNGEVEHLSISANFWSTAQVPVLLAVTSPGPFEPGWDGSTEQVLSLFPSSYPQDFRIAYARMIFLSDASDKLFGKGSLAAVARLVCDLRYVDLFGPAEERVDICPPPLSDKKRKAISKALKRDSNWLADQLSQASVPSVTGIEFTNYLELTLDNSIELRHAYPYLYNCYEHTLGQNPEAKFDKLHSYEQE